MQTRRNFVAFLSRLAAAALLASGLPAQAADTIKVGILHSLSGTMAISETSLKDVALMTIDEINANGGVLGKKLEAVVVDPASNWPLFAKKARQLIAKDKVAAVFGCWTSVSRKSVLPVFKELNSVLFYPVQYEGEELEKNVFYTGAARQREIGLHPLASQRRLPDDPAVMRRDGEHRIAERIERAAGLVHQARRLQVRADPGQHFALARRPGHVIGGAGVEAANTCSVPACPVMRMTGMWRVATWRRRRRHTSKPSMPGISESSRMMSGMTALARSSYPGPEHCRQRRRRSSRIPIRRRSSASMAACGTTRASTMRSTSSRATRCSWRRSGA
jgi:hypothetical protein